MTDYTKAGKSNALKALQNLKAKQAEPEKPRRSVQIKIVNHSFPDEVVKAYLGIGTDFANKQAARESLPDDPEDFASLRNTLDYYYEVAVEIEILVQGLVGANMPLEKGVLINTGHGGTKEVIGFAYNLLDSKNVLVFQVVVRDHLPGEPAKP